MSLANTCILEKINNGIFMKNSPNTNSLKDSDLENLIFYGGDMDDIQYSPESSSVSEKLIKIPVNTIRKDSLLERPSYHFGEEVRSSLKKLGIESLLGRPLPSSEGYTYNRLSSSFKNGIFIDKKKFFENLSPTGMVGYGQRDIHTEHGLFLKNEEILVKNRMGKESLEDCFFQPIPRIDNGNLIAIYFLLLTEEQILSFPDLHNLPQAILGILKQRFTS